MDIKEPSIECGVRCRQIRMAKGMSQQQLADMLHVSSAAISKWEKEGISDINNIMKLSDALGQDIMADQFDQEGSIGEVGKEILRKLVFGEGYIDTSALFNSLYGMKKDRICNELFKLERIGAVVREQFNDFSGVERDGVFITAKGLIAYKNFDKRDEDLTKVNTWDRILIDDANSVQDVIDADVTTDLILNKMDFSSAFRFDYLTYLHDKHMNLIVPTKKMIKCNDFWWNAKEPLLCGESCYVDILRRMAQSASRTEMDETLKESMELGLIGNRHYDRIYQTEYEETGIDYVAEEAMRYFARISSYLKTSNFTDEEMKKKANVKSDLAKKLLDVEFEDVEIVWKYEDREKEFYKSLPVEKKLNINRWFTEDEIYDFVEKNFLAPVTEYEKMIDRKLHDIWEYDKRTLRYYYNFTESWEKSGLAQYIRDKIGVPKL